MSSNYEELSLRAERGELKVKPGTIRRGSQAALEAQQLLMEAAGVTNVAELTSIARGRPSAGTANGPSPVVRARVPQALKDRVIAIAEREHRKESDIVRDALAAYVERAGAAS